MHVRGLLAEGGVCAWQVMQAVWRKVNPVAYAGNADSKESTRSRAHDDVNIGADKTKEAVDSARSGGHKVINKCALAQCWRSCIACMLV